MAIDWAKAEAKEREKKKNQSKGFVTPSTRSSSDTVNPSGNVSSTQGLEAQRETGIRNPVLASSVKQAKDREAEKIQRRANAPAESKMTWGALSSYYTGMEKFKEMPGVGDALSSGSQKHMNNRINEQILKNAEQDADKMSTLEQLEAFAGDENAGKEYTEAQQNRRKQIKSEYYYLNDDVMADIEIMATGLNAESQNKGLLGLANQGTSTGEALAHQVAEGKYARGRLLAKGYSEAQVDKWAKMRADEQNAEFQQEAWEDLEQFSEDHPVAASIYSTAYKFATLPADAALMVEGVINDDIDTTSAVSTALQADEMMRSAVSEDIAEDYGDVWAFAYNTGMSAVDSTVAAFMPGGAYVLATDAATSTMRDLTNRGLSTEEALASGIVAGATELLFENISIGRFKKLQTQTPVGIKGFVINYFKESGVNLTEEAATELTNIVYDTVANGENSNRELMIAELMQDNPEMSRKEAEKQANLRLVNQVVEAGVSGALAGGGMSVVGSAVGYGANYKPIKLAGQAVKSDGVADVVLGQGALAPKKSRAGQAYQQAQKKLDKGKSLSDRDIGLVATESARYMLENSPELNGVFKSAKTKKDVEAIYNAERYRIENSPSIPKEAKSAVKALDADYKNAKKAFENYDRSGARAMSDFARKPTIETDVVKTKMPTISKTEAGKVVSVSSIENIKDGNITVKTSEGTTQPLNIKKDIKSVDAQTLWTNAAENFPDAESAQAYIDNYDGGSIADYTKAFKDYYNLAATGLSLERINEQNIAPYYDLTEQAQAVAVEMGRKSMQFQRGVVDLSVTPKTKAQQLQMNMLDAIGKHTGLNFVVVDKMKDEGFYKTGSNQVVLSLGSSKGLMLRTASHETYHYVQTALPDNAKEIENFVLDTLKKNKGEKWVNDRLKYYEKLGYEGKQKQIDELVADSLYDVFTNKRAVEQFAVKDQSLAQKISNHIKQLIADIKNIINKVIASGDYAEIKAWQDDLASLEKLNNMFLDVLDELATKKADNTAETKSTAEAVKSTKHNIITKSDVNAAQSIGRKSINSLSPTELNSLSAFAKKYWNELGAKSPFFRAWFGDWREGDITPVAVADKKGKTSSTAHNTDTGWEINIPGKAKNETTRHKSNKAKFALPYLDYLEDIAKNAVLLESFGSDKGGDSLLMHSFYAVADIGNGTEVLKLYVEELNNVNSDNTTKRTYMLQNITKQSGSPGSQNNSVSRVTPTAIKTVADLFAFVKQNDKNFTPNPASKIVNPDGTPKVMYHGTQSSFTAFDKKKAKSYGYYGKGFYFTDSESHAGQYGNSMSVYLDVKNPLEQGKNHISKKQLRKFLEAVAENEDYDIWNYGTEDISEIIDSIYKDDAFAVLQDVNATAIGDLAEAISLFNSVNGTSYDGVITPTETVVYEPTQIKSATDNIGTFDKSNPDIRYSRNRDTEYLTAVNNGDMETAQRMVDEAAEEAMPNSLIRGDGGKLLKVYHGSPNKFTVFNPNKLNANGNAHGRGFYFTEEKSMAEGYSKEGGQLLSGYLNITNPMSEDKVTIKKSNLVKLIKVTCEAEAKDMVDDGGYDNLSDALLDTWVSNYVYTYGSSMDRVYREVADIIYDNDSDVQIVAEMANVAGAENVLKNVYEFTGYDGVVYTNDRGTHEFVALTSNQFKSADPVTYDDNGNIIPLSERFDESNGDIRWSRKRVEKLTQNDAVELFEKCQNGEYKKNTYIPVSRTTPSIVIDKAKKYINLQPYPLFMKVEKVQQMIEDEDVYDGGSRLHGIDAVSATQIFKGIFNPNYIFYQDDNGRVTIVVRLGKGRNAFVTLDKGRDFNADLLNGYEGGKYNVSVTVYYLDNLNKYVDNPNNVLLYDKSKVNHEEASGSLVPSLSNDSPYYNDIIEQNNSDVKLQKSIARDSSISEEASDYILDTKEYREILDIVDQRFEATGRKELSPKAIDRLAGKLLTKSKSNYSRERLTERLTALFDYIANSKDLEWSEVTSIAAEISKDVLKESQTLDRSMQTEYADVLKLMRESKVYISPEVKQEIAYNFGSYDSFRRMLGNKFKVTVTDTSAVPLDVFWRELSENRPEMFDADTNYLDMPSAIVDFFEMTSPQYINPYDIEMDMDEAAYDFALQIYDEYFNIPEVISEAKKHQYEIERLKGKYNAKINELHNTYRERIKKLRKEKNNKIEATKALYRQRHEAYKEKRNETQNKQKLRASIYRTAKALVDKLVKPTDQKHIPQELISSVNEFAKAITESGVFTPDRAMRLKKAFKAIGENGTDADANLSTMYNEEFAEMFEKLQDTVAGRRLTELNSSELETVRDTIKYVAHVVSMSNRAFSDGIKERLGVLQNNVLEEFSNQNPDRNRVKFEIQKGLLKPVTFFELIESPTMMKLYENIRQGESKWYNTIASAKKRRQEVADKHNYKSWKKDTIAIKPERFGGNVVLSIDEALSIYATANRQQGVDHLLLGGIVREEDAKKKLDRKKKTKSVDVRSDNIPLTIKDISEITSKLTKEQIGYADNLVEYMSTDMASLGNEVSMRLFGIKKFNEQKYFPLKSASNFLFSKPAVESDARIKHMSMTKPTTPKANNPVVIGNFTETVMNHCNDMALYYSFCLPLEDFNRVYNFKTQPTTLERPTSIKQKIDTAYGSKANGYIKQLLTDINGGVTQQAGAGFVNKMIAKAKKNAVFGSLSVAVQQPSAVARAFLYVDPKYFVSSTFNKRDWDELKKYAPVAGVKEMGYFDTNVGKQAVDWMSEDGYDGLKEKAFALFKDKDYRDDKLSFLPSYMDRITWGHIWNAVKKETKANHPGMDVKSEEFLNLAGDRFTYVIDRTQVYDSVFARSEWMRSKDTGVKVATAFMSEPLTNYNMLYSAAVKARHGDVKFGAKALTAYLVSVAFNSMLKAFVTAGRDDDDDKSYWEKYLAHFVGGFVDEPLGMIPYLKDFVSLLQGYDSKRMDTQVLADVADAVMTIFNEDKSGWEKFKSAFGAVGIAVGIPFKNLIRDGDMIYRGVKDIFDGKKQPTTAKGVSYAIKGELGLDVPNQTEQLVEAYFSNDTKHYNKVYDNLNRKYGGDKEKLASQISNTLHKMFGEGKITAEKAEKALTDLADKSETDAFWTVTKWAESVKGEEYSRYDSFIEAVESDMTSREIKDFIQERYLNNGVSVDNLQSALSSHYKERYETLDTSDKKAVKEFTEDYIRSYSYIGKTKTEEDVYWKMDKWSANLENADDTDYEYGAYDSFIEAVESGNKFNIQNEIDRHLENGHSEDSLQSALTSHYKERYKSIDSSDTRELKDLEEDMIEGYGYLGKEKDSNDIYWTFKEWGSDDEDYAKYNDFEDAVRTGTNLNSTLDEYLGHGVTKKTLASQITKTFKAEYIELYRKDEAEASALRERILDAYVELGYDRDDKEDDIDAWLNPQK